MRNTLTALAFVAAAICFPRAGAASPPDTAALQNAATSDGDALDLEITFDPQIAGRIGWMRPPASRPRHMVGGLGVNVVLLDRLPHDERLAEMVVRVGLRRGPLADASLVVDEATLCAPVFATEVALQRPHRLLLSIQGGLTAVGVQCLRALSTERLYIAACLDRPHEPRTCDGDAEIAALVADDVVRQRVRGLAISLDTHAAVQQLARAPNVEYLALVPGRDGWAAGLIPFTALPHDQLVRVRYLDASVTPNPVSWVLPPAQRFVSRLRHLKWDGHLDAPLPAPCALESAAFFRLTTPDVEALAACSELRDLWSRTTNLDTLIPVARLTRLEELYLRGLHAADLTPLANLTRLRRLRLPAARAPNLDVIGTLTNLRELGLSHTELRSLAPFARLTNLEVLDIDFTAVDDLSPLRGMTALRELRAHQTRVSRLAVVAELHALRELAISNTPVSDLRPIARHPTLARVSLFESAVTNVQALLTLPHLERANIGGLRLPPAQVAQLRSRLGAELIE